MRQSTIGIFCADFPTARFLIVCAFPSRVCLFLVCVSVRLRACACVCQLTGLSLFPLSFIEGVNPLVFSSCVLYVCVSVSCVCACACACVR